MHFYPVGFELSLQKNKTYRVQSYKGSPAVVEIMILNITIVIRVCSLRIIIDVEAQTGIEPLRNAVADFGYRTYLKRVGSETKIDSATNKNILFLKSFRTFICRDAR